MSTQEEQDTKTEAGGCTCAALFSSTGCALMRRYGIRRASSSLCKKERNSAGTAAEPSQLHQ